MTAIHEASRGREQRQRVRPSGLVEVQNVPVLPLATVFPEGKKSDYPFLDLVRQSIDSHLSGHNTGHVSPQQVRSALAVIGESENLAQILGGILNDPRELTSVQMLRHPLGFSRFTLLTGDSFKLKLHMYGWPQAIKPQEEVTENVHSHRFDIGGSRILFGTLQKELFVPSPTQDDEYGTEFYKYYQTNESNRLIPVREKKLRHTDPATPKHLLHKGDIYTLKGDSLHRVSTDADVPTATLFLHTVGKNNDTALVYGLRPDDAVVDYPQIPTSEGAATLEKFLATLKQ